MGEPRNPAGVTHNAHNVVDSNWAGTWRMCPQCATWYPEPIWWDHVEAIWDAAMASHLKNNAPPQWVREGRIETCPK